MSCPRCAAGILSEADEFHGRTEDIYGLPTYISEPPNALVPKGIAVIVPDALGWTLSNSRMLADAYARRTGCRVYLPDFNRGHPMPHSAMHDLNFIFMAKSWWDLPWKIYVTIRIITQFMYFRWYNGESTAAQPIYDWFKALRTHEAANLKIFAAGFCWGGLYATRLAQDVQRTADNRPLIDAAFVAHPSLLRIPRDAELVKFPLSVAAGSKDNVLDEPQAIQMRKILEAKDPEKFVVVMYQGAMHGFAVRGQIDDQKHVEHSERAEDQFVQWVGRWLK